MACPVIPAGSSGSTALERPCRDSKQQQVPERPCHGNSHQESVCAMPEHTMSCWGIPSVMQTTRGISASTDSRMAAAAKGGGT